MIYTPKQLKTALAEKNIHGLALDIDDTLAGTTKLWMKLFQEKFGNPENLTHTEMYEKYRYTDSVPYWESKSGFYELAAELAESDAFQESIPLIANANHTLEKPGPKTHIVAYLTARTASTFNSTSNWLKKHGFPNEPIITRPEDHHVKDRNIWKAKVLEQLYPQVIGIVDDNAGLLKELSPQYKGTVYLYDHKHVPEMPRSPKSPESTLKVFACRDWQYLYETIQKHPPRTTG